MNNPETVILLYGPVQGYVNLVLGEIQFIERVEVTTGEIVMVRGRMAQVEKVERLYSITKVLFSFKE